MASCLALFTLSLFASLVSVSADGLSLKVTGPAQVDDISSLHITATLKNTGASALTVVNDPRSVLSTAPTNSFSISHESGAIPEFTGMMVKFSFDLALKNGGVTTLNPGQTIDVTHSLAEAYNFTNSGSGTYEISPSTLFHAVSEAGNLLPTHASLENSHKVAISGFGRLAVSRQLRRRQQPPAGPVFQGCTADQQNQINDAIPAATAYVDDSIAYLNAHADASDRFTTWFGQFSDDHHDTIIAHFDTLATAGSFTEWTYDCTMANCNPGTYANVNRNAYGIINLCAAFWPAPTRGTDSKGGTLVHEATHFARNAGTMDHRYGHARCEQLAIDDPDLAIENADSHEYFAENDPALA